MQLFSPQVQSPWRTQALMVLDGCHLSITAFPRLGHCFRRAATSTVLCGHLWSTASGRGGAAGAQTRVCAREALSPPAGGDLDRRACPETEAGSPGRRASVPRRWEPSAAGQEWLPVTRAHGTRFFSRKATCAVSMAIASARHCVHPCGPQRPVVGKGCPLPTPGQSWETLPAPEQSRDAVPPRAEQRRCSPPREQSRDVASPCREAVFTHVPGALALWVPVSLCRGWTTGHSWVHTPGFLGGFSAPGVASHGAELWRLPQAQRPWPESLPHWPIRPPRRRAPRAFRVVQGGRGGLPAGLGQLTPSLWRQLLPEVRARCARSLASE